MTSIHTRYSCKAAPFELKTLAKFLLQIAKIVLIVVARPIGAMEGPMAIYHAECHCKAVQFELNCPPMFAQYCHCNKCREVASSSQRHSDKVGYSYTIACQKNAISFTQGEDVLEPILRKNAILYQCKLCKSQVYGVAKDENFRQTAGLNGNNFNLLAYLPPQFAPIRHVYFFDRIIHDFDDDSLPKYVDMPKELGGSGEIYSRDHTQ